MEVDVIIIGAGFAGLACARKAAEKGLKVIVLERKPFAGAKMHTTGILVREAADLISAPKELVRKICGVRLYSSSLQQTTLRHKEYFFLATNTAKLMETLADQAEEAGAVLRYGVSFAGASMDAHGVYLDGLEIRGRFLIGADGARSRVAQHFGLGQNREFLLGLEAEMKGLKLPEDDVLYCFLDQSIAKGYIGWIVPGVDGISQIGVATRLPHTPRLKSFLKILEKVADMKEAQIVGYRGGRIPIGGVVEPFAKGRVILVGDAAGTVSPLTAGGIHTALHYGALLGEQLAAHLDGDPVCIAHHLRRFYPKYRIKKLLRRLYDGFATNRLLDAVADSRLLDIAIRSIFFRQNRL